MNKYITGSEQGVALDSFNEDVDDSLKDIFVNWDTFCKENGIFYDIVSDEANIQGYLLLDKEHADKVRDYIGKKAEENDVHMEVDKDRRHGVLFTFTIASINDDGHWQLLSKKPKRSEMTMFANKSDAKKVDSGKSLAHQGGFKDKINSILRPIDESEEYAPTERSILKGNQNVVVHKLMRQLMQQDSMLTSLEAKKKAEELYARGIKDLFEDQYKSPTRRMIQKQTAFRSSFNKSKSFGGVKKYIGESRELLEMEPPKIEVSSNVGLVSANRVPFPTRDENPNIRVARQDLTDAPRNPMNVIVKNSEVPQSTWICPNCNDEIREKSLYFDNTNWFHRSCGGQIILPEREFVSEAVVSLAPTQIMFPSRLQEYLRQTKLPIGVEKWDPQKIRDLIGNTNRKREYLEDWMYENRVLLRSADRNYVDTLNLLHRRYKEKADKLNSILSSMGIVTERTVPATRVGRTTDPISRQSPKKFVPDPGNEMVANPDEVIPIDSGTLPSQPADAQAPDVDDTPLANVQPDDTASKVSQRVDGAAQELAKQQNMRPIGEFGPTDLRAANAQPVSNVSVQHPPTRGMDLTSPRVTVTGKRGMTRTADDLYRELMTLMGQG